MAERDRKPKWTFRTNVPETIRLISGPREFTHEQYGTSYLYDIKHKAGNGPEEDYVWFATPYCKDFLERVGAKPTSTWSICKTELQDGKKGWTATDQRAKTYSTQDAENAPESPQTPPTGPTSDDPPPADPEPITTSYRPVLASNAAILTKCLESAALMLRYIEMLPVSRGEIVFGGDQVCSIAATLFIQLKRQGLGIAQDEVTDLWIKLKEIADVQAKTP